ncbi:MAG: hypothetical protein QXG40_04360 [Ignisphaera sp.]
MLVLAKLYEALPDSLKNIFTKDRVDFRDIYKVMILNGLRLGQLKSLYRIDPTKFTEQEKSELIKRIREHNNLFLSLWDKVYKDTKVEIFMLQVCSLSESCDFRIAFNPYNTSRNRELIAAYLGRNIITFDDLLQLTAVTSKSLGLEAVPLVPLVGVILTIVSGTVVAITLGKEFIKGLYPATIAIEKLSNTINKRFEEVLGKCERGELSPEQCQFAMESIKNMSKQMAVISQEIKETTEEQAGLVDRLFGYNTGKMLRLGILIPVSLGVAFLIGYGIYKVVRRK